jgi:hypothetical protein
VRSSVGALLAATTLISIGCASAGRRAGVTLADEGVAAAKQTETLLVQTSGTLQPYVEGQFLLAPLRGTAPPSSDLLNNLNIAQQALTLRIGVVTNLAKAYTAMKEHASHDAGAALEKSVTNLTGSVNAYAKLIPGASAIPETAAFVIAKAAGAIAGAKQVKQLKAASVAIRERIAKFRDVLGKEADLLESIRRVTDSTTATNARALWDLGLGQPDPIVRVYLETYGLQYDPKEFAATIKDLEKVQAADPAPENCPKPCNTKAMRLRFGVSQVVRYRVNRAMELGRGVVLKHADALQTLEESHRDFEADQFVDAAAVTAELETLKAIVDELIKLRAK